MSAMLINIHLDRQLHRLHVVNYLYLATVHLFMAGIAFLYAIWHSTTVRSRLALMDVEYTIHAATSVLADLVEKCPPAEACKEAFERMSKATIKMTLSTTGFKRPLGEQMARPTQQDYNSSPSPPSVKNETSQEAPVRPSRPPPKFDMNLQDLFPKAQDGRSFEGSFGHWQSTGAQALPTLPAHVDHQNTDFPHVPIQYDTNLPPLAPTSAMNYSNDPYALPNDWDFLLTNNDAAMYGGNPGIDLGLNGDHNWADGAQIDIFDGFFFGGNTNAS